MHNFFKKDKSQSQSFETLYLYLISQVPVFLGIFKTYKYIVDEFHGWPPGYRFGQAANEIAIWSVVNISEKQELSPTMEMGGNGLIQNQSISWTTIVQYTVVL